MTQPPKSYTSADIYAALVKNPDKTSKEIARIVGCSDGAVRQFAKRNGMSFLKPKEGFGGRKPGCNDPRVGPYRKPYLKKPKPVEENRPATTREIKPGMMGSGRGANVSLRIKENW